MKLLTYDTTRAVERTAQEEWTPHTPATDKFFEWHYITAPMTGANGHQYFLFISNLNMNSVRYRTMLTEGHPEELPEQINPYMVVSHICDYDDEIFKSQRTLLMPLQENIFDASRNALTLSDEKQNFAVDFAFQGNRIELYAKTNDFEVTLHCTGADHVMWMKDHLEKRGLIQQGAIDDRSFYYSLTKLPFHGTLKYRNTDDKEVITDVYGQAWVDRQWGDFVSQSWEWTSFRFADGERINVYNFAGGHQVGVYQKNDGDTEYFSSFGVIQNGYALTQTTNIWFSYGWEYDLPVKDHYYKIIPLNPKNTVENEQNSFFEGLGKILNRDGQQVGWAVTESMDVRVMENAPYQKFNQMPR